MPSETYEIRNRWTSEVMVTAQIDCAPDALPGVKLGLAVRWAVRERKPLARANLARADLAGANLARADLAYVNLAGADLARADLAYVNLSRADLADANLVGAKWREDITLSRAPLQLYGLRYPVTILDAHMQIGCELHPLSDWAAFDDRRILAMDGKTALTFWRAHGPALLALVASDGRGSSAPPS